MNQNHLTPEDLVAAYYAEGVEEQHLATCAACRDELTRIALVLDRVDSPAVPEPDEDYEQRVWQRLQWRLRGEKKRRGTPAFMKWSAVAAVSFMTLCTGTLVWRYDPDRVPHHQQAAVKKPSPIQPVSTTAGQTDAQRDRILLVVVGDHFDRSERVLVELSNLAPEGDAVNIGSERALAEELLASNRIYRRTALDRGEESMATLLDELEPILLQIAHGPDQRTANELRRIQKRVEAKGLVFKLRVLRNDSATAAAPAAPQPNV